MLIGSKMRLVHAIFITSFSALACVARTPSSESDGDPSAPLGKADDAELVTLEPFDLPLRITHVEVGDEIRLAFAEGRIEGIRFTMDRTFRPYFRLRLLDDPGPRVSTSATFALYYRDESGAWAAVSDVREASTFRDVADLVSYRDVPPGEFLLVIEPTAFTAMVAARFTLSLLTRRDLPCLRDRGVADRRVLRSEQTVVENRQRWALYQLQRAIEDDFDAQIAALGANCEEEVGVDPDTGKIRTQFMVVRTGNDWDFSFKPFTPDYEGDAGRDHSDITDTDDVAACEPTQSENEELLGPGFECSGAATLEWACCRG